MKKWMIFLIIAGMITLFAACGEKPNSSSAPESSSSSDSQTGESSGQPPQQSRQNQAVTDLAKTMTELEMHNIPTSLTAARQQEMQQLLQAEDWQAQEPAERGISVDFILSSGTGARIIFFEGTNAAVFAPQAESSELYTLPAETASRLAGFALRVTDEGIGQGNERLREQLYGFGGLLVRQPAEWHSIPKEDTRALGAEELRELHALLKLEGWRLYTGPYADISNDEDIPLTLHKLLDGEDMLLQFKQYGQRYIARSRSYAGPTREDYTFEIPRETYEKLLAFGEAIQ